MAGKAAAGDADEARIRATVRVLSVGQLLRTAQYGISSMVVNQTALGLCGGNHAVVVAHIARAGTLGSLLELLSSPFFGKVTDALGRKPVLLLAGTAKLIPYLLLLISPSMGAIFALNAVQEVAYQMYRLSDQSILADIIKDPKRLAVAQTETSSMMGGALIFGNLLGGYLASTNPKVPLMIAAGCNLAFAGIVSLGLTETHKPSLPIPIPDSPLRKSCSQEGFYLPVLPATKTPEAHARGAVARLLCSGRVLRLLTISNVLTSVVDLTWTIRSVMALQVRICHSSFILATLSLFSHSFDSQHFRSIFVAAAAGDELGQLRRVGGLQRRDPALLGESDGAYAEVPGCPGFQSGSALAVAHPAADDGVRVQAGTSVFDTCSGDVRWGGCASINLKSAAYAGGDRGGDGDRRGGSGAPHASEHLWDDRDDSIWAGISEKLEVAVAAGCGVRSVGRGGVFVIGEEGAGGRDANAIVRRQCDDGVQMFIHFYFSYNTALRFRLLLGQF